jgi:acetyl-CoA decarbonylase/synthase complex subunit gamma
MDYTVEPGLYAVGAPTPESPVLVSANYKLSFDHLRRRLGGVDAWILVLDTKGINVWCAAGKGTFGTDEIVRRVAAARLAEVVTGRRLILPQLGAPGVSAHEVTRQTRFGVVYGPVRAADLPGFLRAGMKATPEMRRVRFGLADRAVLIPVELVIGFKPILGIAAVMVILGGLVRWGYSVERASASAPSVAALALAAFVLPVVLVPLLLPWLPGRAFAAKGAWLGAAMALGLYAAARAGIVHPGRTLELWGWMTGWTALASFIGMNFTGASTYTSLSGVYAEMKRAVPAQIALAAAAAGLWLSGRLAAS